MRSREKSEGQGDCSTDDWLSVVELEREREREREMGTEVKEKGRGRWRQRPGVKEGKGCEEARASREEVGQ